MAKARIGIIGSGDVGKRLAAGFAATGHDVTLGTRDPDRDDLLAWRKEAGQGVKLATNADAAKFGEVLVVATEWSGTENALRLAKPEHFRGKVVIDVTNPLASDGDGPPTLALGHTDSGGEQVQRWLPGAKVVKALNIVNNQTMVSPVTGGEHPTMFLAGDDAGAKGVVAGLLEEFGWKDVVDIGALDGARYLESLVILWVRYGVTHGSWTHAFKLLRA